MIANFGVADTRLSWPMCSLGVRRYIWFRGYAVLKKIHGSAIQCTYKHYYDLLSTPIAIYAAIIVRSEYIDGVCG